MWFTVGITWQNVDFYHELNILLWNSESTRKHCCFFKTFRSVTLLARRMSIKQGLAWSVLIKSFTIINIRAKIQFSRSHLEKVNIGMRSIPLHLTKSWLRDIRLRIVTRRASHSTSFAWLYSFIDQEHDLITIGFKVPLVTSESEIVFSGNGNNDQICIKLEWISYKRLHLVGW